MADLVQGYGGGQIKSMRLGLPGAVEGIVVRQPDGKLLHLPVTPLQFELTVKQHLIPIQATQGGVVEHVAGDVQLELNLQALVAGDAEVFEGLVSKHVKVAVQESMTQKRLVVLDE